jgi:hypothetical protein
MMNSRDISPRGQHQFETLAVAIDFFSGILWWTGFDGPDIRKKDFYNQYLRINARNPEDSPITFPSPNLPLTVSHKKFFFIHPLSSAKTFWKTSFYQIPYQQHSFVVWFVGIATPGVTINESPQITSIFSLTISWTPVRSAAEVLW